MSAKKQVVKVSIFFFLLFTADTSYSAIINYIFEKKQLPAIGPESLFTQYLALAVSLILTPSIPLTLKTKMVLGSAMTTISYFLSIIAVLSQQPTLIFWLLVLASAINGASSGLMWVSQGRYMHLISQIFEIKQERGQIFGIFQLFYCMAMMCGALVTLLGEGFFNDAVYLTFLVVLGASSFIFGLIFLTEILEVCLKQHQSLQSSENRTESISPILQEIREQEEATDYNLKEFMVGFIKFFPSMLCLVPVFLLDALTTGTRLNQLTHLIPATYVNQAKNRAAGIIQICSGVGSVIGGYLASYLTDVVGTIWVGRLVIALFSLVCWLHIMTSLVPSIILAYLVSFLWGFLLFCFVGMILIIISRHYAGKAQAFSINRLSLAVFMMGFQGTMIATDNSLSWKAYIVFSLIPIPAIYFFNRLPAIPQKLIENSRHIQ